MRLSRTEAQKSTQELIQDLLVPVEEVWLSRGRTIAVPVLDDTFDDDMVMAQSIADTGCYLASEQDRDNGRSTKKMEGINV